MNASRAALVAAMTDVERAAFYAEMGKVEIDRLPYAWEFWARPDQLPPPGNWRTWLLLGGRGSGKTRSATEWLRSEVESGKRKHLAIIGPTSDSVRRVMVEGPSGLLAVAPPWNCPSYEPSIRRISWPSGASASLFSGEEPDRLRGLNADGAWIDELCSFANPDEVWTMLQMALRLPGPKGDAPRALVTTTPKNLLVLKSILASPTTAVSRSRTADNEGNLDSSTLAYLKERYGGTSLGRQELDAELVEDLDGALWNRALLDGTRVKSAPDLRRIVVAIDPAGGSGSGSDETGIVVAGVDSEKHGYVLADLSGRYSPDGWARRAVGAYETFHADRIVAEQNFGGAMVEATIRAVSQSVPLKMVHASRGKAVRAEPIVALFEQGKAHIVGQMLTLEDQLCGWEPLAGGKSPDRLDALVWGLSELLVTPVARPAYRTTIRLRGMG